MNKLSNGVDDRSLEDYINYVNCIVHDMKMPISANMQSTDLMLKGSFGKLSERQAEIMEMMQGSNKYLKHLVSLMILTNILEEGKYKLQPENFDLAEMITDIPKRHKNIYVEKHQTVKITNKMEDNIINADFYLIKRVLQNLFGNANKYGAEKSKIEVNLYSNQEYMEFSITNKNRFPEYSKKLITFEKYDYNNSTGGSGLGLYNSRLIIESHHGIIYAEYPPQNKTKITFRIPIKQIL